MRRRIEQTNVKGVVTAEELAAAATWNAEVVNGNLVYGEYDNSEVIYNKSDNWIVTVANGKLTVERNI